jgi:hypothetical protein
MNAILLATYLAIAQHQKLGRRTPTVPLDDADMTSRCELHHSFVFNEAEYESEA